MRNRSKKVKAVLLSIILSLVLILCSCMNGEEEMDITISPEDKTIIQLAKTRYTNTELEEITAFEGSLEELNEQYPIQCMRTIHDNCYRASYLGVERIAILCFDQNREKYYGWIFDLTQQSSAFRNLKHGQSLEDVLAIDPMGTYWFLITGRGEPHTSEHYTADGYRIEISYDMSNRIEDIWIDLV